MVDTLAAQLHDRLLDVDPYTYRLIPELADSREVVDNGATYLAGRRLAAVRFRLREEE